MYKRVLLAYDGSMEGALALREGALLARACQADVILLCLAPNSAGLQIAEGVQGGVVAQLVEGHQELMARAVGRLKELGFNPTARIECGEPAPTISRIAEEVSADLVVVGHRKQSFLERWWSGSTDAYLSDHVGCSVLIGCNDVSDDDFEAACNAMASA
ncbi:MAG TPA: universal stress protein [Caulobacteraceae bacterium]|jgi:nucleotide-binding universal stress UspA family protein